MSLSRPVIDNLSRVSFWCKSTIGSIQIAITSLVSKIHEIEQAISQRIHKRTAAVDALIDLGVNPIIKEEGTRGVGSHIYARYVVIDVKVKALVQTAEELKRVLKRTKENPAASINALDPSPYKNQIPSVQADRDELRKLANELAESNREVEKLQKDRVNCVAAGERANAHIQELQAQLAVVKFQI